MPWPGGENRGVDGCGARTVGAIIVWLKVGWGVGEACTGGQREAGRGKRLGL